MVRFKFVFFFISALMCAGQAAAPNAGGDAQAFEAKARALEQKINAIGRVSWESTEHNTRDAHFKTKMEQWMEVQANIDPRNCLMTLSTKRGDHLKHSDYEDPVRSTTIALEESGPAKVVPSVEWEDRLYHLDLGIRREFRPMPYSVGFAGGRGEIRLLDQNEASQIAAGLLELGQQCQRGPSAIGQAPAGPSLEETLTFIADKLNQQGAISYTERNGADLESITWQVSNATPKPRACVITFHTEERRTSSTTSNSNSDIAVSLRRVEKIDLGNKESLDKETYRKFGGSVDFSYQPSPYELIISKASGIPGDGLLFRDADTGDKVAKAMIHAVELCGGGESKDPF